MTHDWLHDKRLDGISEEKKAVLIEFAESMKEGMTKQQLMAVFMKTQKTMKQRKLVLTPDEASLMIELLKESMSLEEKARLDGLLKKAGK